MPNCICLAHFKRFLLPSLGFIEINKPCCKSKVGLSFLQSGLIRTPHADYFLRPVSPGLAREENFSAPSTHQPHILYKGHWDRRTQLGGRSTQALQKRSTDSTSRKPHFVTRRSTDLQEEMARSDGHEEGSQDQENIQGEQANHHNKRHHQRSDYRHGERQRQHFCGRRKKCM